MTRSPYFTDDYFKQAALAILRLPPAQKKLWREISDLQHEYIKHASIGNYLRSVHEYGILPGLALPTMFHDPRRLVRFQIEKEYHRYKRANSGVIEVEKKFGSGQWAIMVNDLSPDRSRKHVRKLIHLARLLDLMIDENISAAALIQAEEVKERLNGKPKAPGLVIDDVTLNSHIRDGVLRSANDFLRIFERRDDEKREHRGFRYPTSHPYQKQTGERPHNSRSFSRMIPMKRKR
ncbi:MAG TPA: hypothetical protein VEF04_22060 [Blastocatellia bacterium]|nr:hypothetical protein [Blastocatellia bacterium]